MTKENLDLYQIDGGTIYYATSDDSMCIIPQSPPYSYFKIDKETGSLLGMTEKDLVEEAIQIKQKHLKEQQVR